jgi:hypothetical protein
MKKKKETDVRKGEKRPPRRLDASSCCGGDAGSSGLAGVLDCPVLASSMISTCSVDSDIFIYYFYYYGVFEFILQIYIYCYIIIFYQRRMVALSLKTAVPGLSQP